MTVAYLLPISTSLARPEKGPWASSVPVARPVARAALAAPERVSVRRAVRDWACPPAIGARIYREAAAPPAAAQAPLFLSLWR